jgi:hypothetical protein
MGADGDEQSENKTVDLNIFVTKEFCALRGKASERMANSVKELSKTVGELTTQVSESVNVLTVEMTKSLGEVNTSLALVNQWMIDHQEGHKQSWGKVQTFAVVGTGIVALAALAVAAASVLGLFGAMQGQPVVPPTP